MAIIKNAKPLFILNGIPVVLDSSVAKLTLLSLSNNATIDINEDNGEPFVTLGSTFLDNKIFKNKQIITKTKESTSWTIQFIITDGGPGKLLNNLIGNFLNLIKTAINLPCQFFSDKGFIFWGFIENFDKQFNYEQNYFSYSFSIKEQILDLFDRLTPDSPAAASLGVQEVPDAKNGIFPKG